MADRIVAVNVPMTPGHVIAARGAEDVEAVDPTSIGLVTEGSLPSVADNLGILGMTDDEKQSFSSLESVVGISGTTTISTSVTDKNLSGSTIGGANGWWATPGSKGSYAANGVVATATATASGTSTELFGVNQSQIQSLSIGKYTRLWVSVDIKSSWATQAIAYLLFTKAGASLSPANNAVKYTISPGTWSTVTFNVAVPSDADGFRVISQGYGPWDVGAVFELKNASVVTSDRGAFNGDTPDTTSATEDRTHDWDGAPNASTSTRTITTRTTTTTGGLPAGQNLTGLVLELTTDVDAVESRVDGVESRVDKLETAVPQTTTVSSVTPTSVTSGVLNKSRIVALGDSLTSPDGGAPVGQGWVEVMKNESYGRAFVVKNAGIPGNNTSQMLARFDTDVTPFSPQIVTFMGGTNDITQAVPLDTMKSNVQAIYDKVKAIGAKMVIMSIPPRSLSDMKVAETSTWNSWIKKFATDNNLLFVDFYRELVDPATGGYKTGMGNADLLHFSRLGAATLADLMLREFVPTLPAAQVVSPSTNVDPTNLLTNPLLLNGADASPTGWVYSALPAGASRGRVSDEDFSGGKAWETVIPKTLTSDSVITFSQNLPDGSWKVGDKLRFQMQFKITSSDNFPESGTQKGLGLNANFYGAPSGAVQIVTRNQSLSGLEGIAWADLVVPEGTTGPVQWSAVYTAPAGYGITTRVGSASVRNLTALGLS